MAILVNIDFLVLNKVIKCENSSRLAQNHIMCDMKIKILEKQNL